MSAPDTGRRTFAAQARLERLIAHLSTAINARALYGLHHPHLVPSIELVREAVTTACDDRKQDSVTFLVLGDELIVDDRALHKGGLHQQPVIRALRKCGVERLTLGRHLDTAECLQLVEALAGGGIPSTTTNVVVGQLEVSLRDPEEDERTTPGSREEGTDAAAAEHVEAAMGAFLEFRLSQRAGLERLEGLVWSLMDAVSRSTRAILRVAPLKSHDEYTFVHSVNVSLLVLAQARSFGIEGSLLHAIGLAALLHDVGKLSIPLEVLNKPGRLEGEEWKVMTAHAELGAWHLAGLDTGSSLAMLVAYEHHLRFDGQPSYPALRRPRRPTLASQLTAVSDVYDAICTARPYRKALSQQAALDVLRTRAGTFHDPFLVGNFFRLLGAG